jgi:tetratricopeptide (TPR) repeat protein
MISHYRLFLVLFALSFYLTAAPGFVFAQSIEQRIQQESIEQLFQQGNAAAQEDKHLRAEEIWQKVLQIDPNNESAYNNLGIALREQKNSIEQSSLLIKLLNSSPAMQKLIIILV